MNKVDHIGFLLCVGLYKSNKCQYDKKENYIAKTEHEVQIS